MGGLQLAEYGSTIDPSHIIHLIRQLLPVKPAAADSSKSAASGDGQLSEGPLKVKEACTQEKQAPLERKPEFRVSETSADNAAVEEREEAATGPVTGRLVGDVTGCSRESDGKDSHDDRDDGAEDLGGADSGEEDIGEDAREGAIQQPSGLSEQEELREEAGCVLWDLAANESQAEFLVIVISCCRYTLLRVTVTL